MIESDSLLPFVDQLAAPQQLVSPRQNGHNQHAARAKSCLDIEAVIKLLVFPRIRNIEHGLAVAAGPSKPLRYFERRSSCCTGNEKAAGVLRWRRCARYCVDIGAAEESRDERALIRGQVDVCQEQRGPVSVEEDVHAARTR